jgi:hypothetical protein
VILASQRTDAVAEHRVGTRQSVISSETTRRWRW